MNFDKIYKQGGVKMRRSGNFLRLWFVVMALMLFLVFGVQTGQSKELWGTVDWDDPFDLPEQIPGDYKDKWYGF